MPKFKVEYEIDANHISPILSSPDRELIVSGGKGYRVPADAKVTEVVPAFQPGFYRKFWNATGDERWEYFWLTNNASTGYVDVYKLEVEAAPDDPTLDFCFTKPWKSVHTLYERVWFQPVAK